MCLLFIYAHEVVPKEKQEEVRGWKNNIINWGEFLLSPCDCGCDGCSNGPYQLEEDFTAVFYGLKGMSPPELCPYYIPQSMFDAFTAVRDMWSEYDVGEYPEEIEEAYRMAYERHQNAPKFIPPDDTPLVAPQK